MPKALLVTRLDGPEDTFSKELLNPTWTEIEGAIRRLNGVTCTLVCLGIREPPVPHMAIGGGEGGKYIVYCTDDNQTFYTLIDPRAGAGKCLLRAGGQLENYQQKLCVSLTHALQAAKSYSKTGQPDHALTWEKNG